MAELRVVLQETGLDQILGFQVADRHEESDVELMEVTSERSSTVVPAVASEDLQGMPTFAAA